MALIIKDKIQMLKKGYPTVSDKYNVTGGILTGSQKIEFGELVKFSATQPGYYEAITETVTLADLAGFVLATNVKMAEWPENEVAYTYPGEAFNLLINGFMAVELDSAAVKADIKPNAAVYIILATGKLTTSTNASAGTIVELPNVVFTGTLEEQGSKLLAEILVK